MGASWWDYYVEYQPDLNAALGRLREQVFADGDYLWDAGDSSSRPRTDSELWASEDVRESGTHSILDVFRVLNPGEQPKIRAVQPVTEQEALARAGVAKLTRAHVPAIEDLAQKRWLGRCAVLHDEAGNPSEIYFWGFSGD